MAKNTVARATGRMTTYSKIETSRGAFTIERDTGQVLNSTVTVPGVHHKDRVYVAGKKLYKIVDDAPPILIAGVAVNTVTHY